MQRLLVLLVQLPSAWGAIALHSRLAHSQIGSLGQAGCQDQKSVAALIRPSAIPPALPCMSVWVWCGVRVFRLAECC